MFRDCVLVKKGSTVSDVARKIIGDAPIAYIEGVGNIRVAEDDLVAVGKNDVSFSMLKGCNILTHTSTDSFIQGWSWIDYSRLHDT